jgi:hypothetical protein
MKSSKLRQTRGAANRLRYPYPAAKANVMAPPLDLIEKNAFT